MMYGFLTVVEDLGTRPIGKAQIWTRYWRVRCVCGVEKEVPASKLKAGRITSCGCRGKSLKQDLISGERTCVSCGEVKPHTQEYFKRSGKVLSYTCKVCTYKDYKWGAAWAKTRFNKIRKKIIDSFGNKCAICKLSFVPAVYDLHHKNPEEKEHNISKLMSRKESIIFKEVEKCILVCSNCHRELHYG